MRLFLSLAFLIWQFPNLEAGPGPGATLNPSPATSPAPAPTAPPLTLQDCIRRALGAASRAQLAAEEVEIGRQRVIEARAGLLPQVGVASGFTYNSPLSRKPGTFSFAALNGVREYDSRLRISQPLDTSGRLRAALARARARGQEARAALEVARRDLKRAVTFSYYRTLLARRNARLLEQAFEETRDFEKRTRALFEKGEVALADVFKASAQVAALSQSLNQARLEAQLANQTLASFWTDDVEAFLPLEETLSQVPPLPPAPPGRLPESVLRRPEFRALEAQQLRYQADLREARAGLRPQASLVFEYGLDAQNVEIRDRGWAALVNVNIPLFDWFHSRSRAGRSLGRLRQVRIRSRMARRRFSREFHDARARVEQLHNQITLAQNRVDASRQDARLARIRYEGGEGSALDALTAMQQHTQAKILYYRTVVDYLNALSDLQVASGQ